MIEFRGRGILLDVEGTTSSVSFVYDEMFPFVRRELQRFLADASNDPAVQSACELIARDAGADSLNAWLADRDSAEQAQAKIRDEVTRLMDADVKATGLKALQGLIWKSGFASGELISHVYEDVVPALHSWREHGLDLRVYSSGSVAAQALFFGHTCEGDLLPLFSGHYDTQIGGKKEPASYAAIAADWGLPAKQILFLSDVVAELDAATTCGFQTALCRRPGNADPPVNHAHAEFNSFASINSAAHKT